MTTPNTTPNANPNAKTVIAKPITAENGEVSFKLNINPQDISSVEAVYLDLVLTTTSGEKILLPNAALLGATANVICNLIFQNGHKISAADELQQVGIQQPVDGASFRLSSVQNPVDSEQINGRDFGLNNSNQDQSSQLQNQAEQVAQLLKSLDAATQSNSTTTSTSSASGPGFSLATSKSPTVNVLASASPGAPPSPKNANTSSGTANINDSARSLNGGESVQISGTEMSPPANGTIIGVNMGGNVSSPNATGFSDVASSNMRSGSPLTIAAANTGAITTNTDTWGTTVHNTLVMPGVSSSANVTVTLTLINTAATGSSLAYSTVQALQAIGFQINQQAITASTTSFSVSASSLSNLNFDLSWTAQSSTSVNQLAITALKQFQFGVQYQYTDALGVVHSIKGNPVTFTYDTSATATTAKDSNGNAIFDLSATGMSYKIIANDQGSQITTGYGDDTIISSQAANTITGGQGNNTISYEKISGDVIVKLADSGSGTGVKTTSSGSTTDQLNNIVNIIGSASGNDTLQGNSQNNIIVGGGGNNTFVGSHGSDAIFGSTVSGSVNTVDYSTFTNSMTLSGSTQFATINKGVNSSTASSESDTLSNIQIFDLGSGHNLFAAAAPSNMNVNGGTSGSNSAQYNNVTDALKITLGSNSAGSVTAVVQDGTKSDQLLNFQSYTGSATSNQFVELASASNANLSLNAGTSQSSIDYSAMSGIHASVSTNQINVTKTGGGVDTLSGIQTIVGSQNSSDQFSIGAVTGLTVNDGHGQNSASYVSETSTPLAFSISNSGTSSNPNITAIVTDGLHSDLLTNISNFTGSGATSAGIDNSFSIHGVNGITVNGGGSTNTASYTTTQDQLSVSLSGSGSTNQLVVTDISTNATDTLANIQSFTGGANGTQYIEDTTAGALTITLNGTNKDAISYAQVNSTLNITEVSANGISATVSKSGGGVDSLDGIAQITTGAGNNTVHGTAAGSFTVTGGAGVNTADYSSLSTGVSASFTTTNNNGVVASVTKGNGATDTLTNFDSIVGTSGNDTYKETSAISGVTISGGSGSNTMNDSVLSSALTFNITGSSSLVTATVTDGAHTDTLSNVTSFVGGSASNTFNDTGVYGVNVTGTGSNNNVAYTTTDKLNVAIGSSSGTSSAISVSDATTASSTTDTLNNIQTITGGSAQNTFAEYTSAASQSLSIVGGGNASTSANYQGFSNGVTITETSVNGASATVSKGTTAGTDTLSGIQIISTNSANDTLIGSTPGNYTLSAGAGANTADYSSVVTTTIQANGYDNSIDVNKGSTSDTLSGFNHFVTGVGNDTLAENTNIAGIALNAGTGSNAADYSGITTGTLSFTIGATNGNITSTVTDGAHTDILTNVQTFTGGHITTAGVDNSFTLNGVNGVTVNGGGATNTASYANTADKLNVNISGSGSAATFNVTDTTTNATDSLTNIQSFTGGANGTTYAEDGSAAAQSITLNGKAGDSLNLSTLNNNLTITEVNANGISATINKGTGTDSLSGIFNITAGAGNDQLVGTATGSFTIDGGAGNNTATYAGLTTGVTATINSSNGVTTTSINKGSGNIDSLSSFQAITGTSGNDSFKEVSGVSNVTLDGGAGTNTADYSGITSSALTFNVSANSNGNISATVTDGAHTDTLANIQSFVGANDNASGVDNTFNLNGVNGINVAGQGTTNAVNYTAQDNLQVVIGSATGTSTAIAVTDLATHASDTLTGIQQIAGGAGVNTFTEYTSAAAQNLSIVGGGNASTSANYQGFSNGVTITETTLHGASATISKGMGAGTDTLSGISHISTNLANDTLVGTLAGNYAMSAGAGNNTANYTNLTANVSIGTTGYGTAISVIKGTNTDTLSGFNNLATGAGNDTLNETTNVACVTWNAGTGSNTANYAGITNGPLTFTIGSTNGNITSTVSDGSHTDTLTNVQSFTGGNITTAGVDNSFTLNGVNGVSINGGGATNTASYANTATNLVVSIAGSGSTDSITVNASGKTDTLNGIQTFTGGANVTNLIEDSSAAGQNFTLIANTNSSITYANATTSSGISINEVNANGVSATVNKGSGVDTLQGLYHLVATGTANDTLIGTSTGAFTVAAGSGTNTANYAALTQGVSASFANVSGTVTASVLKGSGSSDSLSGFTNFIGSRGNDTYSEASAILGLNITGGTGANTVNDSAVSATPLTFNITGNSASGLVSATVSDGVHTDVLSNIKTFVGGNDTNTGVVANTFNITDAYGVNVIANGVNNAANYSTAANLTVNVGQTTANGIQVYDSQTGQTDTLQNIQSITGGTGVNNFIEYAPAIASNLSISGGGNTADTISYLSETIGLTITQSSVSGGSDTILKGTGNGTDTVTGIHYILAGQGNDTLMGNNDYAANVSADTIVGAGGNNTANYGTFSEVKGLPNLQFSINNDNTPTTTVSDTVSGYQATLLNFNTLIGSTQGKDLFSEAQTGTSVNNYLMNGNGNANDTVSYTGFTTTGAQFSLTTNNDSNGIVVHKGTSSNSDAYGVDTVQGITTVALPNLVSNVTENFSSTSMVSYNFSGQQLGNSITYNYSNNANPMSITLTIDTFSEYGNLYQNASTVAKSNGIASAIDTISSTSLANTFGNYIFNVNGNVTVTYMPYMTQAGLYGTSKLDNIKLIQAGSGSANVFNLASTLASTLTLTNASTTGATYNGITLINFQQYVSNNASDTVIGGLGGIGSGSGFVIKETRNGGTLNYGTSGTIDHIAINYTNSTVKKYNSNNMLVGTDTISGFGTVVGTNNNDTFTGNISNSAISGTGGNDSYSLNGSNDTLNYTSQTSINVSFGTQQTTVNKYSAATGTSATLTSTDTISVTAIQFFQGSSTGNDTFTGATSTNTTVILGTGNDSINLSGATSSISNTVSYASLSTNTTLNLGTTTTVSKGSATDTIVGVQSFITGTGTNTIYGDGSSAYNITGHGTNNVIYNSNTNTSAKTIDHVAVNYTSPTAATVTKYASSTATTGLVDTLAGVQSISGSNAGNDSFTGAVASLSVFAEAIGSDTYSLTGTNDTVSYANLSSENLSVNYGITNTTVTKYSQGVSQGTDIINGSTTTLVLNDGNDTFTGSASHLTLNAAEAGSNTYNLSGASETVSYANLSDKLTISVLNDGTGTETVTKANGLTDTISIANTNVIASSGSDTLIGNGNGTAETLNGGTGSNTFYEDAGHNTTSLAGVTLNGASGTSNNFVLDASQLNTQCTSGAAKLSITGDSANTANTLTLTGTTSATIDLTNNTHLSTSNINTLDLTGVTNTAPTTLSLNSAMIQSLVSNGNSSVLNIKLSSTETYNIALSGTQTDTYNTSTGMVSIYSSATQNSSTMIAQAHITGITNLHG